MESEAKEEREADGFSAGGSASRVNSWLSALAWGIGCLLLAETLILARQNHALKLSQKPTAIVPTGVIIRGLVGVGMDGKFTGIPLPGPKDAPLLLFTFGPRCGACVAGANEANQIAQAALKNGWQVAWVSDGRLNDTKAFARQENLPQRRVITEVPERVYLQLGLGFVPQTLILRNDGVVAHAWAGEIESARYESIMSVVRAERYGNARSASPNTNEGEKP